MRLLGFTRWSVPGMRDYGFGLCPGHADIRWTSEVVHIRWRLLHGLYRRTDIQRHCLPARGGMSLMRGCFCAGEEGPVLSTVSQCLERHRGLQRHSVRLRTDGFRKDFFHARYDRYTCLQSKSSNNWRPLWRLRSTRESRQIFACEFRVENCVVFHRSLDQLYSASCVWFS